MTPETVRKRVEKVEKMSGDDESAHSEEDALYIAVLRAIARGADDPRALAREALRTRDIKFARWCA